MIGGGYATGRELAEFFVSVRPAGRHCSRWRWRRCCSASICVVTFLFARMRRQHGLPELLPQPARAGLDRLFEAAYMFSFIADPRRLRRRRGRDRRRPCSGWPTLAGVMASSASIAAFTTFGNTSVERLFKYASFFLYGVYALFVFFALQPLRRPSRGRDFARAGRQRRLGARRGHLRRLQHHRRGGDPAGPAPPDQHARRRHRRPARGAR